MNINPGRKVDKIVTLDRSLNELYRLLKELEQQIREELHRVEQAMEESGH